MKQKDPLRLRQGALFTVRISGVSRNIHLITAHLKNLHKNPSTSDLISSYIHELGNPSFTWREHHFKPQSNDPLQQPRFQLQNTLKAAREVDNHPVKKRSSELLSYPFHTFYNSLAFPTHTEQPFLNYCSVQDGNTFLHLLSAPLLHRGRHWNIII